MLRRYTSSLYSSAFLKCLGCSHHQVKIHTNITKILSTSNFMKDLPNPSLPTPVKPLRKHDADILSEELRKASNIERILKLSSDHLDVMNARHIILAMQSIHDFSRNKENFNSHALLENEIFQAICTRIMKLIRVFDPRELINVYKVLTFFEVPNNTYVMQSVLRMLSKYLNDLSISQLVFLNFLLMKQKHNSLVDGLRMAIPLVLQVQIEHQIDTENMPEVVNCLQIACKSRLKPAVVQKIVSTLVDKAHTLTPDNAVTVIFALLNLNTPMDGYDKLLNYCFELVAKNLHSLNKNYTLPLIRITCGKNHYHHQFLYAASKRIDKDDWNLKKTWEAMTYFKRLDFCPENVMDHFTSVICKEAASFVSDSLYLPLNCARILSSTDYCPPHLAEVLTLLCSCKKKIDDLKNSSNLLYTKFLSTLAMLGHFPQNMLPEILNEDYLFSVWSESRKIGQSTNFESFALSLAWNLEIYDQQNKFTFPTPVLKSLVQSVCERHEKVDYPLQKFIENGLGGEHFLQTGIMTRDGVLVDHIVAMRRGNYPVALHQENSDSRITSIEDLNLPTDAKIVAVIAATEDQYIKHPEILRNWMNVKIKYLKKKKLIPVVINYKNWRDLPDREKIPYLMREINDSTAELASSKANIL
ncbi:helitron_like_N domain-containing protein [Caerostris darwini]|uniref:Helitron_like_N domain-containing protein n=1 Tax=Caerostris darwini TaxID=1538125 RepID=A0AAV4NHL1_9ARAC|nr:helitron_like_N domain-containing protein [Caerostris darwini]